MKVLFLDAYNLIYRAKSGFTKGEYPVVYNFFRGVRPLVEKFNPDKVYFVLEGNPQFRKTLSEGLYKNNRPKQNRSFYEQKATIISLVKNFMPFEVVKHPQLECDDTIATLSTVHVKKGDDVVIVSSDSDFIQLLDYLGEKCKLYNPVKKSFVSKPEYDYVVWKALNGDSTDNISGIKGVGPKTAEKLTKDPQKLLTFLNEKDNRAIFEKNVNLIRLVDFSNNMSELESTTGSGDFDSLKNAFEEMSFDSMLKESTWKKYTDTFKGL
jgi:DNA polymerase-1